MKLILLGLLLTLVSCGNHPITHNNTVYNCYGAFDSREEKKSNVVYELSTSNIIGVFVFSETLFIPVWNLGWNTYCPVRVLETK